MPKLTTKIEGRGNGIKTVIPNMVDISKALHMPPSYPTKFFGVELGAQSKFDKSTERAVVNGAFQSADLAVLLNKFIELFVLCPNCRLPETTLKVKKGAVKADCAACGFNGVLEASKSHRLTTYILKNPPKGSKKSSTKTKKDKSEATATEKKPSSTSRGKKEKEEKVVWKTDISKDAVNSRRKEEMESMVGGAENIEDRLDAIIVGENDLDMDPTAPEQMLRVLIASGASDQEVLSELRRLELARDLSSATKIEVLIEGCLDARVPQNVVNQVVSSVTIFRAFASTDYEAKQLWGGLEKFIGFSHPELMSRTPLILQALYEGDVLDEDTIVSWADSGAEASWLVNKSIAEEIRRAATPFVEWLRSAEEDEEEEEDE